MEHLPRDPWQPPLPMVVLRWREHPRRALSSAPVGIPFAPDPDVMRPAARRTAPARRWAPLAVLGALFLTLGLGVAGFSGYRLWGTGFETAGAQGILEAEFADRLAGASGGGQTAPDVPAAPDSDGDVSGGIPTEFPPFDDPVIGPEAATGEPPEAPGFVVESRPAEGEVLGRMRIPVIGADWMVVEGVRPEDLARGPGHGPWSVVPGQAGNAVISGHRTTYGAPFNRLDELQAGDLVVVDTLIGQHVFQVVGARVVLPGDTWVVEQWDGVWLTITTCHPEFSAAERLVVFTRLVSGPNLEAADATFDVDYRMPEPPDA